MTIDVHEFLDAVFAERSGDVWTIALPGDPTKQSDVGNAWKGRPYEQSNTSFDQSRNLYYVISELKPESNKRTEANFQALRVVVLDDVGNGSGAKVNPEKITLPPTYRIETSPGNEQWGFVLDAPLIDKAKAKRLLELIKATGTTDKGGMHLVRAVRLPAGINGKTKYGKTPFAVRLVEWQPERRYSPEAIARAFGMELEGQRGRPRSSDLPPVANDADPVLKLLDELGAVRERTPNDRGFVEIVCPWSGEHSDGKDTAGYKPGGIFRCLHDHCSERTIADLLEWLREQRGVVVDEAIATMPGPRGGALRAVLRYGFVRDVDLFVDLEQGKLLPASALDHYLANDLRNYKPTKVLLDRADLLRTVSVLYLPGKPEVLEMSENGKRVLAANTWRAGPIGVASVEDDARIKNSWLAHAAWLFPDETEREIVLDFLTHIVQRRGVKINWMLVALAQMQGTGRDTLLKPVRDILGIRNVATIGVEQLFGSFNEWELTELVCFSEADAPEHNRWKVYRALKSKIVKPPDTMHVNIKNVRGYDQIKVANYIMFTNDPTAVAMDRGDRRVSVVETPRNSREIQQYVATGVFKRLHSMYADPEWMQQFHSYLLRRSIAKSFDPEGRAPETAASRRMFDAARSTLEVFVEEGIEAATAPFGPDLVKALDILPSIQSQPGLGETTLNALSAALRRAGADKLPDFKDTAQRNMKNVWALRDIGKYTAMTAGALREAWAKCCEERVRRVGKF